MDEKELEALKTSNPKAYEYIVGQKTELEKLKAKPAPKPDPEEDPEEEDPEEDDLGKKAARERASKDQSSAREKRLESALRFNMSAKDFLKQNESLLPQDVSDIFAQAEKEKFEDAIEKDEAIKSGLIQAFFRVQANVDLLTSGQKAMLDDYLKLTKTGKQERAQTIYDMVFEPAFESLKRTKKAEALSRGHSSGSDIESGYKKRLIEGSRKHYLGEKHGT
jgi:hypothetical protein